MKRITKVIIAVLFIILTLATAISVVLCYKTQSIKKDNMEIYLDKQKKEFIDKSGAKLPSVELDGKTYVPLEAAADLANFEVKWDKNQQAIMLADKSSYKYRNEAIKGKISVRHFNRDAAVKMLQHFKEAYPNIEVILNYPRDEIYENKTESLITSGENAPDVIAVESLFAKRFIEMPGAFLDIGDIAKAYRGNMIPYTVQIGTDQNGVLRALSDTAAPGAIAFKKGVAKKYLGTDDHEKVKVMFSTPENMLKTARLLKEKSGGNVSLFAGFEDLLRMYIFGRSQAWVVNNRLTIDKVMLEYIDVAKTFRDNKYESGIDQWSSEWSAAIADDEKIFALICPTWGIPWILGSNDKKAEEGGRWGLVNPTFPFFWGGTWYGIYSKSPNKDAAWEFVKFFTAHKDMMKAWANENQELPNNLGVISQGSPNVNKIVSTNVFEFFEPLVKDIKGDTITRYDEAIYKEFVEAMKLYLDGSIKSKEDMVGVFKNNVKLKLKDIEVQ
ncbi:MAG TPA: extracellular solute-binding protein [Pseudobacteroides sp.]|uniref:extracellular solute-binding protein n=1 Tax=Pseudobacteroides sp. TaxID=1968840 RepID=UPI002F92FD57